MLLGKELWHFPLSVGINSERKEFAYVEVFPVGAIFSPEELTPVWKGLITQEAKRSSHKLFPFVGMTETHVSVQIYLNVEKKIPFLFHRSESA